MLDGVKDNLHLDQIRENFDAKTKNLCDIEHIGNIENIQSIKAINIET